MGLLQGHVQAHFNLSRRRSDTTRPQTRVSVACMTLSAGELWQIILSISAAPTVLVGWIIAVRIRQTLTRIELKHQKLVRSARIDGLTGLRNRPGFDAIAAEAFEETRRSGQPVSALASDIDAFRGLNEEIWAQGWRPRSQKSRLGPSKSRSDAEPR